MLLHGSVEVACISGGRRYIADVLVGMMYFASSAPMGTATAPSLLGSVHHQPDSHPMRFYTF
jgi:thiamine transporter ThiT